MSNPLSLASKARLTSDVAWQGFFADSNKHISCAFIDVDKHPLLAFPMSHLRHQITNLASGSLATPGVTPQTHTPSSDIFGLSSTPAGNAQQVSTPPAPAGLADHDSDARLVDVTDETWGVIMDGNIEDLNSPSHKCAALASGYLVKRAGARDEDGLLPLGVNILYTQDSYRSVLKDVLGMYRNLGTLARVRAVIDPVKSLLPLHVAAARKAHEAVSATMRYGDYENDGCSMMTERW